VGGASAFAFPIADLTLPPPPPCATVGSGVEANPDTAQGICPGGQVNDLRDSAGNFCCNTRAVTTVPAVPESLAAVFGVALAGLGVALGFPRKRARC
jgi:hypothetical protein